MSNENILVPKKIKTKMKKNISYQINPLYNKRNIFLNINSISNNNYLSSVNNILLSENIKIPNLKSIFNDENIEENNMKNNLFYNSIDSETSHRNKSNNNIIAPLKNLKYRKNLLPVITEINNKDKNLIKQKFINKFNFDIINNKNFKEKDSKIKKQYYLFALNLSLFICYYIRITPEENKYIYENEIKKILKLKNDFIDLPLKLSDYILDEIEINPGIAKNKTLKINILIIFVCINTYIPIFICGKPGSSKSLSVHLIYNSMKG
jgi:hypothetical protein